MIFISSKDSDAIPLFLNSNVLTMDLLYVHTISKLMLDVV